MKQRRITTDCIYMYGYALKNIGLLTRLSFAKRFVEAIRSNILMVFHRCRVLFLHFGGVVVLVLLVFSVVVVIVFVDSDYQRICFSRSIFFCSSLREYSINFSAYNHWIVHALLSVNKTLMSFIPIFELVMFTFRLPLLRLHHNSMQCSIKRFPCCGTVLI